MFGTIIVGLDGSPRQPLVLRRAVQLADVTGGELVLVRAVTMPTSIPEAVWSFGNQQFLAFLIEHAHQQLERVVAELPEGLVAGIECREGRPSGVLCEVARERRAALVIIGTHGFDRVDRLLGTTAARVTNHAPCSVLVVRDDE